MFTPRHNLNYKSILIITYGRSGSTLLQGILNSIDGCIIRGENELFHYGLYKSYLSLVNACNRGKGDSPNKAWYRSGSFNEKNYLESIKKLNRDLLIGKKGDSREIICYGFKEIRYIRIIDELFDYLDFLSQIFPEPAFIFNTRKLDDVVRSGWWKKQSSESVIKKLQSLESKFREYMELHDNCYLIDYFDIVNKSENLEKLFGFLGAEYNENQIDDVLSVLHSYEPTQEKIKNLL